MSTFEGMTLAPRRLSAFGDAVAGRLRRRLAGEDGLGLVEVMIALFVVSVAVLGLATSASGTLNSLRGSRDRQQATIEATQAIEQARALGYSRLAHRTGEVPVAGASPKFDADGTGTAASPEDLVVDPAGAVRSTNVAQFGTTSGRTITTYVTWMSVAAPPDTNNAKRVTAVVTWGSGGTARTVRQSTVVSAADSGIEVSDFEVSPVQRQAAPFEAGERRCFQNTIQNEGQTDRYDIVLHTTPANYTVAVYGDSSPYNGIPDAGEQLAVGPGGHPRTPEVLTNGTVPVLTCYEPLSGAEPTGELSVTFQSAAYPTQDPITVIHWLTRPASFALDPASATLIYDGNTRYCYPHSINNSGEPDRYRFTLPTVTGYAVSVHVDEDGLPTGDGTYEVALAPDDDGVIQTDQLTPTGGKALVAVCYEGAGPPPFTAVVAVASTFNPEVAVSLTNVLLDPPPVFELSAPVQTLRVGPQESPCFSHVLTNQGARADTYSLALSSVARYTVSAYVDGNANGVGEAGELLSGATPSVAPTGTLRLLICYRLDRGSNSPFTTTATVSSARNASVTRAVQHTVAVGTYQLFLHDRDNTQNHSRTFGDVYAMNHDPTTQTVLYDYDQGLPGNDGRPGAYVTKDDSNAINSLRWRYTFTTRTVIDGAADLRLSSSYTNALAGSTTAAFVRPVVVLQRRRVDGTVDSLSSQTFSYTHNQAGWMQNVFTSTLSPSVTFEAGDSLVLQVYCAAGAGSHCHFAYDTAIDHPAALTLRTVP